MLGEVLTRVGKLDDSVGGNNALISSRSLAPVEWLPLPCIDREQEAPHTHDPPCHCNQPITPSRPGSSSTSRSSSSSIHPWLQHSICTSPETIIGSVT